MPRDIHPIKRLAVLGNHLPRHCGIATFTTHIADALAGALPDVDTFVLAMNDASIGGKVAVDLPEGKNLVGAFHQPRAVIADTSTLRSLPRRAFTEGFGEIIKHALILDPQLLGDLEKHAGQLQWGSWDSGLLAGITARSMRLKALVVSADPLEQGLRAILNYGHTKIGRAHV